MIRKHSGYFREEILRLFPFALFKKIQRFVKHVDTFPHFRRLFTSLANQLVQSDRSGDTDDANPVQRADEEGFRIDLFQYSRSSQRPWGLPP